MTMGTSLERRRTRHTSNPEMPGSMRAMGATEPAPARGGGGGGDEGGEGGPGEKKPQPRRRPGPPPPPQGARAPPRRWTSSRNAATGHRLGLVAGTAFRRFILPPVPFDPV